jgi:hypothetical protein
VSSIAAAALALCATGMFVTWAILDLALYRPLRRAAARGDIDQRPGTQLRRFEIRGMGANPDIDHRYLTYDLEPGRAAVIRGRVALEADYYSVVLYDRLLQSVPPSESPGPTYLAARDLRRESDGSFVLVLARRNRNWPNFLDVSAIPRGVVFERHIGAAPPELARFAVMGEDEVDGFLESLHR